MKTIVHCDFPGIVCIVEVIKLKSGKIEIFCNCFTKKNPRNPKGTCVFTFAAG